VAALLAAAAPAAPVQAASRYDALLASTAGQDTLRNIALFEDQRVTGEGKLFEYLAEGSPLVQRRALEAIGRIQDPADAPKVIPFVSARDRAVAREAIFALGQLGNREAVAPIIKARGGAAPEDMLVIAEALGKLGGEEAVAALVDMLRDFTSIVRGQAALGLARCKDPVAANALLLAIHDPDPGVAWRAIYALEKQDALPRTCQAVFDFLEHADPLVRAFAARTLGKHQCSSAVAGLRKCLHDDDTRVVVNAARALARSRPRTRWPTSAACSPRTSRTTRARRPRWQSRQSAKRTRATPSSRGRSTGARWCASTPSARCR